MTQIRADALAAALERGVAPIAWVHGDEPLLVQEATGAIRRALRAAGFDERQVFDAGRNLRPDVLLGETNALSLFASNRLIELRFAAKPGKELGQAIADAARGLDENTRILVSSPRLDRTTTESAWFTAIDRAGWVVPVFPVERAQLPQWITGRLAQQGQRADRATIELIAERVEGNLLAAHQEIRKLGLLFDKGELPPDETRAAVLNVARYDAFDLVGAMLAGDAARALRSLDGLHAEGEAEPLILWALSDAIRTLLRLTEARQRGRPLAQALREARVFGPRERLYGDALRRADAAQLQAALRQAAKTDRMIKGIESGDTWQALETLVMMLAGAPALGAPLPARA
ncbi:MAG: DNA polymerase III subunit delta [Burkholderiales bacterium]|nr:DNA polymerase III subunit delta [Burkholderiales bacterium]